jgi:hypothetical protein
MPRYFFHVRDGRNIPDEEGTVLSDTAEARKQAVILAGGVLLDAGESFWHETEWRLWVTDEMDKTVCALRFAAEPVGP